MSGTLSQARHAADVKEIAARFTGTRIPVISKQPEECVNTNGILCIQITKESPTADGGDQ